MNKLQKKLKIMGGISSSNFNTVRPLINIMDSITVVKSKWHESFKQSNPDMYPLDLSKMETWSTYQGCTNLTFRMINDKWVECEVIVFNGDSLYGHRTNIRFSATLKVPYTFLTEIKDNIKWAFEIYCEEKYTDHLQKQKEEWVRKFAEEVLDFPKKR